MMLNVNHLHSYFVLTVCSASDLKAAYFGISSDPYVVVSCARVAIPHSNERTPTIEKTLHPQWNYRFNIRFPFDLSNPSKDHVKLTVWDQNKVAKDEYLGEADFYLPSEVSHQSVIKGTLNLKGEGELSKTKIPHVIAEHIKPTKITGKLTVEADIFIPAVQFDGRLWSFIGEIYNVTPTTFADNPHHATRWGGEARTTMERGMLKFEFSNFWREYQHSVQGDKREVAESPCEFLPIAGTFGSGNYTYKTMSTLEQCHYEVEKVNLLDEGIIMMNIVELDGRYRTYGMWTFTMF